MCDLSPLLVFFCTVPRGERGENKRANASAVIPYRLSKEMLKDISFCLCPCRKSICRLRGRNKKGKDNAIIGNATTGNATTQNKSPHRGDLPFE